MIRNAVVLAGVGGAFVTAVAAANPITYSDYVAHVAINYDGVSYTCTTLSDPTCAFITITATSDTGTVYPFSVSGADGLKNTLLSATMNVAFNNGQPGITADISTANLYVSVDQSNGGAGFGSSYGPTYPAATFSSSTGPGNAFEHYDLASDFYLQNYGPFCPDVSVCQNGGVLYTTDGKPFVITYPFTLVFSVFSSTVATPVPGALVLFGFGLVGLTAFGRRRSLVQARATLPRVRDAQHSAGGPNRAGDTRAVFNGPDSCHR